jgi:hypothetical protein
MPAHVRPCPARRRLAALAAGFALLAAVAGCSSGPKDAGGAADGKPPAPAPHRTSPSPSANATASASTKPSASPATTAEDGTDYGSCKDGTCQVSVSGPADIPVGRLTLHASVSGNTVSLRVSAPGAETNMTLSGTSGAGRLQVNGETINVRTTSVGDGSAVLDITP